MQQEPLDVPRLLHRTAHYAARAGATPSTTSTLTDLLRSPLGSSVLALATDRRLASLLVSGGWVVERVSARCQPSAHSHLNSPQRPATRQTYTR
jgi:hypothetical protein